MMRARNNPNRLLTTDTDTVKEKGKNKIQLSIKVDTAELDNAIEKARELVNLLEKVGR